LAEELITHSAEETTSWGRQFAARLKAPIVVLLSGELGSGKTTLTKGIVSGLGAASEEEVTSPTFTLVHVYGQPQRPAPTVSKVHHVDLYRIENFHDFETLGMEDVFEQPGILIVEWADRFPLKAPWPQIRVRLEHLEGDNRRLTVMSETDAYL
jgi:tRNA threonylcarbamoyladenosine biosynthesis protein TsaE